ncbi:MAG: Verru_Chthon cassette protein D [Candidatus Methylacidiphilales bacterium]|nr:Verru_Chthon cassette protein D [Candidatus Methylacidiphilales bacterium]
MKRPSLSNISGSSAFTLIELMAVMTIIGLLVAMTVPLFSSVSEANSISAGSQIVVDQVSQARQMAAARNVPIEVRFVLQPSRLPGNPASYSNVYNAVQLWRTDPAGGASQPAAKLVPLPNGIVIAVGSTAPYLSPPLASTATPAPLSGTLSFGGTSLNYVGFEIRPAGLIPTMLDQGLGNSYVSIVPLRYSTKTSNDLKGTTRSVSNFALVQINPFTASARIYQP